MPSVRHCWMCTTSVQDDALSSHQIVKRGTARLKSFDMISAPWSPSLHVHEVHRRTKLPPCSRRLEAVVSVASACSRINSVLCTTPEASRSTMVAPSTSASSTQTTVSSIRSCAAPTAHGTRESHQSCHVLGIRAEARSQCLPCRSFHSNL